MNPRDYDEAARRASKHLIPLQSWSLDSLISNQVENSLYLTSVPDKKKKKALQPFDKHYISNNNIWEDIIWSKFRRTDINISLDSFFLFEWLPRSPGLFYTIEGKSARKEAQRQIQSIENGVVVYDPYGKQSMLDGGIGNIRLKPIRIDGMDYYFCSASSGGEADQGFPVAIPETLYNQVIEEMSERGAVVRNLVGKLKFIPGELETLYKGYRSVPHVYLKVDSVLPAQNPKSRRMEELRVNVAISFLSNYEGQSRTYASYVGFDPSDKRSFEESIRWIEQEYVERKYRGKVLTDFDQIMSNFSHAPFSLDKVMNLTLNQAEISKIEGLLQIDLSDTLKNQHNIQVNIKEFYMESKYNITGGSHGIIGDHAQGNTIHQNQQLLENINLEDLGNQLSILRQAAKKESSTGEHDMEVGKIAAAEASAKTGDKSKLLENLKSLGKWSLDIATKIGTPILTSLIKSSMHIPE